MAYVRTVKTSSGATAVQIVWSSRKGSRRIEHIGSAHHDAELAALKAATAERLAAGRAVLDLAVTPPRSNLDEALRAELAPVEFSWTSSDIQLYHLDLGAGQDPMDKRESRYLVDDTPQVLHGSETVSTPALFPLSGTGRAATEFTDIGSQFRFRRSVSQAGPARTAHLQHNVHCDGGRTARRRNRTDSDGFRAAVTAPNATTQWRWRASSWCRPD